MFDAKKCPFLHQETPFTAFLSRMSRESQHTRFEDQILGQVSLWGPPASCASLFQVEIFCWVFGVEICLCWVLGVEIFLCWVFGFEFFLLGICGWKIMLGIWGWKMLCWVFRVEIYLFITQHKKFQPKLPSINTQWVFGVEKIYAGYLGLKKSMLGI